MMLFSAIPRDGQFCEGVLWRWSGLFKLVSSAGLAPFAGHLQCCLEMQLRALLVPMRPRIYVCVFVSLVFFACADEITHKVSDLMKIFLRDALTC